MWLCVLGQQRWWTRQPFERRSDQPRTLAASCVSQPERTGQWQISQETQVSPWPFEIDLEVLRLKLGADLSLDCRHQLRQSWRCEILEPFFVCLFVFLRAEVKHKPRWLQIGFKKKNTSQHVSFFYTYKCVENIWAVVYMVLVKCVWMPTPSYATKSKDVLKSFLGTLQCLFIHSCILNK